MNIAALIIGLIQAASAALGAVGVTDARVLAVAALVSKGMSLAGSATTASANFIVAMKALTAQVKAMHDAGVDDLTDAQQADLDAKVAAAHAEIAAA